ncbi:MAG: hypothetical protein HN352_06580 [Bacteroidetes bacterium]|jgi:hypothetical protein|nr:hypothetical protein [Bacteroidota bacterium]MBT3751650.1 hypothetical protein [Bacteroidota bacterium]MBT4402143.1 hypothetical protein [Bacteroidota bacterium]MBT4409762.1 hypothetical protein [Bacteroidota bacterium]MBT5425674.1 hypothetical protein [Bacteroidota bacterium]
MMKHNIPIFLIFLIAFISLIAACDKEDTVQPDPYVSIETDLMCNSEFGSKTDEPGPGQSCVWWEYDGDSTLLLQHFNAGFNCCPEEILLSLDFIGDTIVVTERDSMQLCRCNCLYNLDITVHHVKPKKYVVQMLEPFVKDPKSPLIFNIDLVNQKSGKVCDDRDYYPWH